ncbi:MAG: 2OG-Fe(II) oxygenase [Cyanothece sp. SIO1E1]|nr:2OG-Fe(II) oxygenase [Cyanothece sp. SIO1E1]
MGSILDTCYIQRDNVLSGEHLRDLTQAILTCPYLATNQLSDSFDGTLGFSIIFKASGRGQAERQFPFLKPYLKQVVKQTCNAFYFNALVLYQGTYVDFHVDSSMSSYGRIKTIPNWVSILYAQVPADMQGGELILQGGDHGTTAIQPRTNTLVSFLGFLRHAVTEVMASQPRISLICEQYKLTESRLQKIPEFQIESETKNYAT